MEFTVEEYKVEARDIKTLDPQEDAGDAAVFLNHLIDKRMDHTNRPPTNFIELNSNPHVWTPGKRAISADWLCDVTLHFSRCQQTFHLAMGLLDNFTYLYQIEPAKQQLYTIACFWIACKFQQKPPPLGLEMSDITDYTYTKDEIIKAEEIVLNTLRFNVNVKTTLTYVYWLLKLDWPEVTDVARFLIYYALDMSVMCYALFSYTILDVAIAIIWYGITRAKSGGKGHYEREQLWLRMPLLNILDTSLEYIEMIAATLDDFICLIKRREPFPGTRSILTVIDRNFPEEALASLKMKSTATNSTSGSNDSCSDNKKRQRSQVALNSLDPNLLHKIDTPVEQETTTPPPKRKKLTDSALTAQEFNKKCVAKQSLVSTSPPLI